MNSPSKRTFIDQLLCGFKNFLYFIEAKRCRQLKISPDSILFPVIWVTNKCNLRCRMCDQWKTTPAGSEGELSRQEWYSFVDSASHMHATVIVITGGEPLLRDDIFDLIKYIGKKGIAGHLCTNGTLLNESTVNRLKDTGLNSISVSLDSYCADIHNELRGVDCFDTVVRGIELLRRFAPALKIGINYVVTKRNFRNMDRMIPFVESLGVDQIKFDPVHTNLMHKNKHLYSFEGLLFTKDDLPQLKFEIDKLIYAVSKTKLLTTSQTFMKGICGLYNNSQHHRLRCYAGYVSCAIDAFGRVSPCDNFEGNVSLRDKPLEEIWRSESFQQLRKVVADCNSSCWDSTHAELNIRSSDCGFMKEFNQILKESHFYLSS